MKRPMIEYIIEALEPTFEEMVQDESYYTSYSDTLCSIDLILIADGKDLVRGINLTMQDSTSMSGKYNAACDVASCLESLCPEEYSGKFVY